MIYSDFIIGKEGHIIYLCEISKIEKKDHTVFIEYKDGKLCELKYESERKCIRDLKVLSRRMSLKRKYIPKSNNDKILVLKGIVFKRSDLRIIMPTKKGYWLFLKRMFPLYVRDNIAMKENYDNYYEGLNA